MRGRVISVLFLLILSASPSLPQCSFQPVLSVPYRASVLDVMVGGNDLWAATSYGLSLYDRSVHPPALVASLGIPGITRKVRIANGLAYAASGSSIAIVRRNGAALQLVRLVDAGAQVNDLHVTPLVLIAATANGISQYDLLDVTNPTRTNATFATSAPNITSLAVSGSTLYAADGDSSVEVFSIAIPNVPQKLGTIASLPRSTSVRATPGRLYVSDGTQTEILLGSGTSASRAGTAAFGASSLATINGEVAFTAGGDRRIHAADFTLPGAPVELFEADLAPSGGTINRVSALQLTGNRLYAGGGDLGLLTYDLTGFTSPYPVRSFPLGSTTSVVSLGSNAYVTPAAGGIAEISQSLSGSVSVARQWGAGGTHTARDASSSGFLFTSRGNTLTQWTLVSTTPNAIWSATFRANISNAAATGTTAYALLDDGTLWSAPLASASPTPAQVDLGPARPTAMARSGASFAFSQVNDDGTTTITFVQNAANFAVRETATVPGAATTGIALSANTAAIFTFRGINLVSFPGGVSIVLPQSTADVPKKIAFAGSDLFALTDDEVVVWNTVSRTQRARFPIPSDTIAVHKAEGEGPALVDVATTDGIAVVSYASSSRLPQRIAAPNGNAYYRKIVAANDRVYLFDGRAIDVFGIAFGNLRYVNSIRVPSIVDFAASDLGVFTLASGGAVTAFGADGGTPLAQTTINEGADLQSLAVQTAGEAVWVSISRGCFSGGCEKRTFVLDPRTLARGATLTGGVTDLVTAGTRAYVLFDLPSEVRVYDIGSPLQPAIVASRATEGTPAPVSIAASGGTVYVLGEKLYAYAESGLTKISEQFASYTPDASGTVAFVDQRLRIDGSCALITGRAFQPQLFTTQWTPASTPIVPSAVKSVARTPGRLYLLTDYSLEIWSATALPEPPKRRATR